MFAYCNNNPIVFEDVTGFSLRPTTTMISDMRCFPRLEDANRVTVPSNNQTEGINEFLTDSEERAVLEADNFAFYKDTLVIKVPGDAAFSFGIIFMGSEINNVSLVQHEYGHTRQLQELGLLAYYNYVLLPSITCFWLTEAGALSSSTYYSYPWEYVADLKGGAVHNYTDWASSVAATYWVLTKALSKLTG